MLRAGEEGIEIGPCICCRCLGNFGCSRGDDSEKEVFFFGSFVESRY